MEQDFAINQPSIPNLYSRNALSDSEDASHYPRKLKRIYSKEILQKNLPSPYSSEESIGREFSNSCEDTDNLIKKFFKPIEVTLPNFTANTICQPDKFLTNVLRKTTSATSLILTANDKESFSTLSYRTPQTSPKSKRNSFLGKSSADQIHVCKDIKNWFLSSLPPDEPLRQSDLSEESKKLMHKKFIPRHAFLREMDTFSPTTL